MDKLFIYIDTDLSLGTPGAEIDDGAALLMLLRNPAAQIVGIGSVFGNVPVRDATCNLARMLEITGHTDIPLAQGAAGPLEGDMSWFAEWQAGYSATLPFECNEPRESSADMLVRLANTYPDQLSVIAIGPSTNLALALEKDPEIAYKVKQVVAMGGSFGSQPQAPEFNVHCDPSATRKICAADWPLTLLGLDITRQAAFSRAKFAALPDSDPILSLLKEQADSWITRVESMGWEKDGCSLHDAVAAAYLLQTDLFNSVPVEVEISDGSRLPIGTTLINPVPRSQGSTTHVVSTVKAKMVRDFIWSFIDPTAAK
ncbi:nucleoside hydrolase [Pelolinea submarina]|uniref:Purine nucleosidase/uridine nucleosidase n=1 Tax=Pelolinea submarina TaxID=913107 RepID=A0A347ZW53_9CHLR|nr:nucleoside hydrolase [Pelolinea submarina]REG07230.1 purine nucleosidase/uridine nucleosidase [Pelolinea submarina]BBB49534.1 uridine nucleosidase [Pelolinea submarina]